MILLFTPPLWFTMLAAGLSLLSFATMVAIAWESIRYARHDSIKSRMRRLAEVARRRRE